VPAASGARPSRAKICGVGNPSLREDATAKVKDAWKAQSKQALAISEKHVILIFLFAGYFRQLPGELEEAARIDGAGYVRIFWQVMLPLAKPAIATAMILSLMRVWNSFLIPLVLTLARPDPRTLAVGVYSFQGEPLQY